MPGMPPITLWRNDIREREAAFFIAELIGDKHAILNIGPSWGRDYYHLSALGKSVVNLDIASQRHLPRLVIGDITRCLPFRAESFDAVVVAEVLEHLIEDAEALQETKRVLENDGLLIVSVPFFDDDAEFHVHIHSPKTIRRLLQSAGYQIVNYYERGGLVSMPHLLHGLRRLIKPLMLSEDFDQFIYAVDRWLARRAGWMLRRSKYYGCYLSARKSSSTDFRRLNVVEFRH